jgi:hypothetical protein
MNDANQNQSEVLPDTRPKPFVFVLMPFDKKFMDVYNAHALGKVVLLLTQDSDDIPFDLKHYPHIVYGGSILDLIPQLETKVRWAIQQSTEETSRPEPVEVYCQDIPLLDSPVIDVRAKKYPVNGFRLKFTYGSRNKMQTIQFAVTLWTSGTFASCNWSGSRDAARPTVHPAGKHVFHAPTETTLLPDDWQHDTVDFTSARLLEKNTTEEVELRILTDRDGTYSHPFIIKLG